MTETESDTEGPFGLTPDDEGEKAVVRYQSVHHPNADKTEVRGTILDVADNLFFIEDEQGRTLEVGGHYVSLYETADGRHKDVKLGEAPSVEPRRLFEVAISGAKTRHVRSPDSESARDRAIKSTNFGDLYNNTDVNAARRVE